MRLVPGRLSFSPFHRDLSVGDLFAGGPLACDPEI